MNFKKFFVINEVFSKDDVQLGDILSSLQSIKDNIDNIKRKNLVDMLNSVIVSIVPFLKSKNDKKLLSLLQRIAYAIKNDIEENNDFKETLESSVSELENYFKSNNIVINAPIKTNKIDNVSKPIEQEPKDVKINGEPVPDSNSMESPPLAGNGDNPFDTI